MMPVADPHPELQSFLHPRHVVVIGGSPRPDTIGGRPVTYLRHFGFQGTTSIVNPSYAGASDFACYRRLGEVPGDPDLAIITVRAALVADVVAQCGARGITSAIVFSAGFAETSEGGITLQERLRAAAHRSGVRLCGPNSLGVVSAPARLGATFATSLEGLDTLGDSGVSLVSQSGALAAFIHRACLDDGTSFRYVISTGNEVDVTAGDFLEHLVNDPESTAIALCLENLRDGDAYLRALDAAARLEKPIILFQVGASTRGRVVAQSHTGAIATDSVLLDAVSRQRNVSIARDIDDLVALIRGHAILRPKLRGGRVAVVSVSGGFGVWAADVADESAVELAKFSETTGAALAKLLPPFASATNPIDVTGQVVNDPHLLTECLSNVVDDAGADIVLVALGLQERNAHQIAASIEVVARRSTKPIVIAWTSAPSVAVRTLRDAGLLVYESLSIGLRATVAIAAWSARSEATRIEASARAAAPSQRHGEPIELGLVGLTEADAKVLLGQLGVDVEVPRGRLVESAGQATAAASELGYPVVLKGQSDHVVHKAAVGLVATDLHDEPALVAALDEMERRARKLDLSTDRALTGYLVEEQVGNRIELIVSARRTPRFGTVVLAGIGGVYAEAVAATASRRAPLTRRDIDAMLGEARIVDLLRCLDEKQPVVIERIVALIDSLSSAVARHPELGEIELNPVAVTVPQGRVIALDAVVVPSDSHGASSRPTRGVGA